MKTLSPVRADSGLLLRLFSVLACASLLVVFFAAPLPVRAQADPPPFQWSVDIWVPGAAEQVNALGDIEAARAALESNLATRISAPGVSARVESSLDSSGAPAFTASISGSEGLAQLRQVIFTDLAGLVSLPDAGTELVLEGAAGQSIQLTLDANASTGYGWDTSALDPAQFVLEGEAQVQFLSYKLGAPQRVTYLLKPTGEGALTAQLFYRRPWLADAEPKLRLSIQAAALPPVIDLSDPGQSLDSTPLAMVTGVGPQVEDYAIEPKALPAEFDWRHVGGVSYVTPVKDQSSCGSCWAFGATGVLESAVALTSGGFPSGAIGYDGAEQYLVNCNDYDYGCDGGWWDAHNFHYNRKVSSQSQPGSVAEVDLPYTADDGSCAVNYAKQHRLAGWYWVNPSNPYSVPSVEAIKQAIYTYGPIGVSVCTGNTSDSAFDNYSGGVFTTDESAQCPSYNPTNHAVVLVGWNDAEQAWIMKNSWDTWWGEDGYMRIKWGTSRIGYAANYVSMVAPTVLTSPTAGKLVSPGDTTFTWQPASGASGYRIQVAYDSAFTDLVFDQTTSGTSFTWLSLLPSNVQLYWRVQGASSNYYGPWTGARSLKVTPHVPTGLTPASTAVNSLRPTFGWTENGTYTKFEVQVGSSDVFSAIKASGSTTATTWAPAVDLPRNTTLFWRVRAVGKYGASPWSQHPYITTPYPPYPSTLTAPANGVILSPSAHPTFAWKAPTTGVLPEGYVLEISPSSKFDVPFFSQDVGLTQSYSFGLNFVNNTLYYWRVRGYFGNPKAYSNWTSARTVKILPVTPMLSYPAADSYASTLRPTFTWESQPNNPRYDINIARTNLCGSVIKTATVTTPRYIPTSDLPRSVELYWRVRTRGAYGISAWSECRRFYTQNPPPTPVIVSPASGATLPYSNPLTPVFTWKLLTTGSPTGFRVQVSAESTFPQDDTSEKTVSGGAATTLNWGEPLGYATYYWRMCAVGAGVSGDTCSSWTTTRSFKTHPALQGYVTEAYLGIPVPNATVTVVGTGLSTTTDETGYYRFPVPVPAGTRTISVSQDDIVTTNKSASLAAGGWRTVNISVKKKPIQIVLDWNSTNHFVELDANLWLPAARPYHIKWDRRGSQSAFPFAQLTRETSDYHGPEPIIIARRYTGTYTYAVARWDFSADSFQVSGATVKVYRGSDLVATYPVPTSPPGSYSWWHVFDLNAVTGAITPVNQLTNDSPGPYDPDMSVNGIIKPVH